MGAYRYTVLTCKFVGTGRVGLTVEAYSIDRKNPFLIVAVEDLEVVVIDIFAEKDIRNEFDERGLPGPDLSNKKDRV